MGGGVARHAPIATAAKRSAAGAGEVPQPALVGDDPDLGDAVGVRGDVEDDQADRLARRRAGPSENGALGERDPQRMAIGLTGDPVTPGIRSGAITHRKDQRPNWAHSGASSSNRR